MAEFFVCIAFVLFPLPLILAIIAIAKASRLRQDVERIREELARLTSLQPPPTRPVTHAPTSRVSTESPTPPPPPVPPGTVMPNLAPFVAGWADAALDKAAEFSEAEVAQQDFENAEPFIDTETEPSIDLPPEPDISSTDGPIEPDFATPQYAAPKPPMPSQPAVPLEQRIIRLAVGVGGLALALAGIFLVKVAFEHNYLNPAVRVMMGTFFGAALLAAGLARAAKNPRSHKSFQQQASRIFLRAFSPLPISII